MKIYNKEFDLLNCDQEPLRHILRIQSYAHLLILDRNCEKWLYATEYVSEKIASSSVSDFLRSILGKDHIDSLKSKGKFGKEFISVQLEKHDYIVIPHFVDDHIILEFELKQEPTDPDKSLQDVQASILNLVATTDFSDLLDKVVMEVKTITDFDRIMIYEFDREYNGIVIRENKKAHHTSYLGLKFPHTDIPQQARDLYFEESIRLIYNTGKEQKNLLGNTNLDPVVIDLSNVHARGVSPIHVEYLKNMGVTSSFSVAIVYQEKLWGLIACHSDTEKLLSFGQRKQLRFLAQLISLNVSKQKDSDKVIDELQNKFIQSSLVESIASSQDLIKVITDNKNDLHKLLEFDGLYVSKNGETHSLGTVPDSTFLDKIIEKSDLSEEFDVLTTCSLSDFLGEEIDSEIAGAMLIQISKPSKDYIIFFRRRITKTISWGGNPNLVKSFNDVEGRISPRKSFEKWQESVKNQSKDWTETEVEVAKKLKSEIREFLYARYNELLLLNQELKEAYKDMESFGYTVSHDLKAPLRSIEGFANIIKEDYASSFDEQGLKLLDVIMSSVAKMNEFITDILHYSKLNNGNLNIKEIDPNILILKIWEEVTFAVSQTDATLIIQEDIPPIYGDKTMIRQVFQNILSNAIKYVDERTSPSVEITVTTLEGLVEFQVGDNGIGIPADKTEKVFEMFRRLVRDDDYAGTGIGLAIVKKVVDRHGGQVKAEPKSGGGSIFSVTLPSNDTYLKKLRKRT